MIITETYTDLTIVILAGGQSTRMGTDKGLLAFNNSNFSTQLISLAKRITPNVIVSVGNQNQEAYKKLDTFTVLDQVEQKGPMGGIVSVMPYIKTEWFMLISVDSPLVSDKLIAQLWDSKSEFDSVVFRTQNRIHPLVGLYNVRTKPKWESAFASDNLKVTALVNQLNLKVIEANTAITKNLKNINTPTEYNALIEQE